MSVGSQLIPCRDDFPFDFHVPVRILHIPNPPKRQTGQRSSRAPDCRPSSSAISLNALDSYVSLQPGMQAGNDDYGCGSLDQRPSPGGESPEIVGNGLAERCSLRVKRGGLHVVSVRFGALAGSEEEFSCGCADGEK